MSSSMTNYSSRDGEYYEYLDITDLVRHVASECLSLSHPFTPAVKQLLPSVDRVVFHEDDPGANNDCCGCDDDDAVIDGTLLGGLHVQGKAPIDTDTASSAHETTNNNANGYASAIDHNNNAQHIRQQIVPTTTQQQQLPQLNLLDAMSALELGDKRMDCCEIPFGSTTTPAHAESHTNTTTTDTPTQIIAPTFDSSSLTTFPPRIAPTSLSDGVSILCALLSENNDDDKSTCPDASGTTSSLSAKKNTLLMPTPPCLSLLPHWDNLRLSSTSLLPLLLLQLTALEAYIGTNNGGSTAAETLYCMLWFHDGVLYDMAERLGVKSAIKFVKDMRALKKPAYVSS